MTVVEANHGRTVPHPFAFFLANGWNGAILDHPVLRERKGAPTVSHGLPKKRSLLLGAEFGAKNLLNEVKELLRAILSRAWTGRAFPASIRFR